MNLSKKLFHPKGLLDDTYELVILLKALGGLIESLAGIALLFTSSYQINEIVVRLTRAELLQDPNDFIATHLAHWSAHLGSHATLYGSVYLLSHGVLKIGIVVALMFKKRWAYPLAIVVFSGFAIYQLYATIVHSSVGMGLLTIYDVIVIWLVWLEYRKAMPPETPAKPA